MIKITPYIKKNLTKTLNLDTHVFNTVYMLFSRWFYFCKFRESSLKFPLQYMAIYSNQNIPKIVKLSHHKFPYTFYGEVKPFLYLGFCSWSIIHWASKETYNFLEWCPLKSTASKWMIFGLMLATFLVTHVKKQRNRMCQKWDKCLQITTSPISKSQKLLPFHRTDFRTFQ